MYETFSFQEDTDLTSNIVPDEPTYYILSSVVNHQRCNGRICYLTLQNRYFIGNKSYTVRKYSPLELQLCLAIMHSSSNSWRVFGKNDKVKTFFGF